MLPTIAICIELQDQNIVFIGIFEPREIRGVGCFGGAHLKIWFRLKTTPPQALDRALLAAAAPLLCISCTSPMELQQSSDRFQPLMDETRPVMGFFGRVSGASITNLILNGKCRCIYQIAYIPWDVCGLIWLLDAIWMELERIFCIKSMWYPRSSRALLFHRCLIPFDLDLDFQTKTKLPYFSFQGPSISWNMEKDHPSKLLFVYVCMQVHPFHIQIAIGHHDFSKFRCLYPSKSPSLQVFHLCLVRKCAQHVMVLPSSAIAQALPPWPRCVLLQAPLGHGAVAAVAAALRRRLATAMEAPTLTVEMCCAVLADLMENKRPGRDVGKGEVIVEAWEGIKDYIIFIIHEKLW